MKPDKRERLNHLYKIGRAIDSCDSNEQLVVVHDWYNTLAERRDYVKYHLPHLTLMFMVKAQRINGMFSSLFIRRP